MGLLEVVLAIAGGWICISVLVAFVIGRAIAIADRRSRRSFRTGDRVVVRRVPGRPRTGTSPVRLKRVTSS